MVDYLKKKAKKSHYEKNMPDPYPCSNAWGRM
jgi:hypothetical protein